jgi:hypothetical protein
MEIKVRPTLFELCGLIPEDIKNKTYVEAQKIIIKKCIITKDSINAKMMDKLNAKMMKKLSSEDLEANTYHLQWIDKEIEERTRELSEILI